MNQVVSHYAARMPDPLPRELLNSADLVDLSRALLQIHFPASWDDLKTAPLRMAFNEIFLLQFGVLASEKRVAITHRRASLKPPQNGWNR